MLEALETIITSGMEAAEASYRNAARKKRLAEVERREEFRRLVKDVMRPPKPKSYHICAHETVLAAMLLGNGLSQREISRKLGRALSTTQDLIHKLSDFQQKWREQGYVPTDVVLPGFPAAIPKVSTSEQKYVERLVLLYTLKDRRMSCRTLAAELARHGVHADKNRICEIRKTLGLEYGFTKKRSCLTPFQKENRCRWCRLVREQNLLDINWIPSDDRN
jgi:transposase